MSYLEPRGGHPGSRASDPSDAPPPYAGNRPPAEGLIPPVTGRGAPAPRAVPPGAAQDGGPRGVPQSDAAPRTAAQDGGLRGMPQPGAAPQNGPRAVPPAAAQDGAPTGPVHGGNQPDPSWAHQPTAPNWVTASPEQVTAPSDHADPPFVPEPAWAAPTAATSTSQAEWELTTAETTRRGPGKRRAGRDGRPAPQKQPAGRAGRNLPAAIAVGASLVLVVLASMLVWKPAFLGVIALASGVGIWEMVRALKVTGARPPLVPLVGGGLLMTGLAWYEGPDALEIGLLATLLAALVWRFSEHKVGFRRDMAAAALIAVYVPFLLSFGVLLVKPDDGPSRVLCTLLAVVLSDTGGYAAGVFFGKHPMAPRISPKKSWEGFAGSVTAAAVGGALLVYFLLDVPFYWGLLFGAVISVAAVVGDLAESMLKRDIGIKDMSNLLPGHGGVMDRLDSILFAVPAAYLLLSLIAPPG
ncbi:phosphatidate cytidylyltransferase [Couchioplanes caeruleus]|uniref:phosphatidate cytidylyltransferase n=1 Tax=Couchioplanes caeruleus TaxID=56438 RepID=UPI0020BDC418|nr:phosphatidate cytidylyltransferase [Couchioplanes caeruleus]UQU66261.1 phosphatidate cytidylyltransferase [Couchioplanes caeruleus]